MIGTIASLRALLHPFRVENGYWFMRRLVPPSIWLMGADVEFRHLGRIEQNKPAIIVSNHQSNLDLYFLGGVFTDHTVTMGKRSLRWVPFFGWLYYLSSHVFIDRGDRERAAETVRETAGRLKREGLSMLMFPEGTRSLGKPLGPFKRGAFHLGIETGFPVIPVAVSSYVHGLNLGRWRPGRVIIEVLEPIPTQGKTQADLPALSELTRQRVVEGIARLDAEIAQGSAKG